MDVDILMDLVKDSTVIRGCFFVGKSVNIICTYVVFFFGDMMWYVASDVIFNNVSIGGVPILMVIDRHRYYWGNPPRKIVRTY